jgi:hypothetical protein
MNKLITLLYKYLRRPRNGYFLLGNSLIIFSATILTSPWWLPFLTDIYETYTHRQLNDFSLIIGLSTLSLGIFSYLFGIYRTKQDANDKAIYNRMIGLYNYQSIKEILTIININMYVVKQKWTRLAFS